MDRAFTPRDYALYHLHHLADMWPPLRDADVDGIHDARVLTRRIRATLPFVPSATPATAERLRDIGRALSQVRELDVTQKLLLAFESQVSAAPSAIALLGNDLRKRRSREARRMVKALDEHPRAILSRIKKNTRFFPIATFWRDWRHELRTELRRRAGNATTAIDRATAVYMPNRSHTARIAVKKLRYTLELALATDVARSGPLLDDVKKAQDALGELHDLHVLAKTIDEFNFPTRSGREEAVVLAAVVAAELSRTHQKYLRHRTRLHDAFNGGLQPTSRGTAGTVARVTAQSLSVAGLVAVKMLAAHYIGTTSDGPRPSADNKTPESPTEVPVSA